MELLELRWCVYASLLLLLLKEASTDNEDVVKHVREALGVFNSKCDFSLLKLWNAKLREAPLTAPPLFFDVDGDGFDDIVAPSFSGEVWGIHGENGHIVDNWPFYLEDRAFHASPLVYDVNKDGVLEFLLTTTDAEVVFVQTDNTLLHGETIKIPPLRVKRKWHQMDPILIKEMANQISVNQKEGAESHHTIAGDGASHSNRKPSNFTTPFSEFESRFGRHADPLYSRHDAHPRRAGVDPADPDYVFVDPHVLATPVITDIDGDGTYSDLVVAVSYYYDAYHYGDNHNLDNLNGLTMEELVDFTAGGVVIIDLESGKVKVQRLLGITRGTDSQPGYLLATPTAVRLTSGEDPVIIIGSVTGELHVMDARTLEEREGFPLTLDSITAQVAVSDIFHTGSLDMLVGDQSGNVYCIDGKGRRIWEKEVDQPVRSAIRLVDVEGDGMMEVVFATQHGDVWVLRGQTGQEHGVSRYPIHLNSNIETSPLVIHLNTRGRGKEKRNATLGIVVAAISGIYILDTSTGCVDHVQVPENVVFYDILSGDIDPYNPGLELLAIGLDGQLVCFRVLASKKLTEQESWSGEATGHSLFDHKKSSFYFTFPFTNTSLEVTGKTFNFPLTLHSNNFQTESEFSLVVTVGQKYILYEDTINVNKRVTEYSLVIPSPPSPLHSFMLVRLCNVHLQCRTKSLNIRFNLHFEDNLKWFLCLPFFSLCGVLLWVNRQAGGHTLPIHSSRRKDL